MRNPRTRSCLAAAALSAVLIVTLLASSPQAKPGPSLAAGGLDGSLSKGMQNVELPARVSRVAYVPGTNGEEAWAIGHMLHADHSWNTDQTVFLHYTKSDGWTVYGPPRDSTGNFVHNLSLSTISFAEGGEGWAVGSQGALVHHVPGSGWIYSSACDPGGPLAGSCAEVYGVSVVAERGKVVGYAVGHARSRGSANTILRYDGSSWLVDQAIVVADPNPVVNFEAVSTVNAEEAWAVGASSGRELQVFRRNAGVWTRQRTNQPLFDNPAPSSDEQHVNLSAMGWTIAASRDGSIVWVGGGMYPVDPAAPIDQSDAPFTFRCIVERGCGPGSSFEGWTSYCPPQYSLYNDDAQLIDICDEPMPLSSYDISSITILPGNEVFAGGLGLFHFKDGVWWREPNSNSYLSSIAFASASEGWVASSGNKIGGGGMAASSSTTLGHYTSSPARPKTARWPNFNKSTLYGVTLAPSGNEAVAVGNNGVALLYKPISGWDRLPGAAGDSVLRAVAWSDATHAWAVGARGAIGTITRDGIDLYPSPTAANLNGVAFNGGRGFAVGERGTILHFSNGGWRADAQSGTFGDLFDVAAVGGGFVAVGSEGTILSNPSGASGGWGIDNSVAGLVGGFPNYGRPPNLFAVSATREGRLVVGGAKKFVAVRDPGGDFRMVSPINARGAVLDLQAVENNGLKIFASFSNAEERFRVRRSTLMYFDGTKWQDLDLSSKQTSDTRTDTAAIQDPVFSLALDSSGVSGWAVGGLVPNATDENQNFFLDQTSSVYRFNLNGDPAPHQTDSLLKVSPSGINFAYFSESSCGSGYCSISVGSGTLADEVALRIREQINRASRQPNGPKFVIFGGGMRAAGLPEELEEFRGYLSEFVIPVFAAMGPGDLFTSGAGSSAETFLPELPDDDLERAGLKPPDLAATTGSNQFFLETFANEWAPWGTGGDAKDSSRHGILPVEIGLRATPGLARTHYAFDYAPGGRRLVRFVVLDTSDHLYSKQAQSSNQNPQNQDQSSWLSLVVSDAKDPTKHNPPLPVIVTMNVPSVNPLKNLNQPVLADGKSFEAAAVGYGLSAVLTGYVRANATYWVPAAGAPGAVPIYVLGTGGAPPPRESTKYPNDGQYHSWALVNVDPSGVSLLNPQAKVTVETIPVIESVFLHPLEDLNVEGGWTLQFHALARALTGGTPPGDSSQKRMSYMQFPTAPYCIGAGSGVGGFCLNNSALAPSYQFVSENPPIADFVKPSGLPRYPAVVGGFLVPDDQSGFLCTFKAGTVWVKIIAGMKQMRLPVTVKAGFGPCVEHPIQIPEIHKQEVPLVEPVPEALRPFFRFAQPPQPYVLTLPPVPAPIPAPAPPASAAGARKEEEEAQYEQQEDEGDNQAVVLSYERRSTSSDPIFGWLVIGAGAALGMLLALAGGSIVASRRTKPIPAPIYVAWRRDSKR